MRSYPRRVSLPMVIALTLLCTHVCRAQASREAPIRAVSHQSIERIAATAAKTNDYRDTQSLVDEVLRFQHAFRIPDAVRPYLSGRLTEAQYSHVTAARAGVREKDLSRIFNTLVEKFGLPSYAFTSELQVHAIRMSLILSEPTFMGAGVTTGRMKIGDRINDRLSPLQAMHLLAVLADQKLLNPTFQVEPSEWDQQKHESFMKSLAPSPSADPSGAGPSTTSQLVLTQNSKKAELTKAVSDHALSMSTIDGLSLMDDLLSACAPK